MTRKHLKTCGTMFRGCDPMCPAYLADLAEEMKERIAEEAKESKEERPLRSFVVYSYGENSVHHHKATDVEIKDGLLFVVSNGIVVGTYNESQWIGVRMND